MKKFLSFVLVSSLILSAYGCTKVDDNEASQYGEEIFVCDSGNLLGLEGVHANEGNVTLLFDEDVVFDSNRSGPGFGYCFEGGSFLDRDYITVFAGDEEYRVQGDDIAVNADEMTIVFDVDDIDTDEITGVHFFVSFEVSIDFEEGVISGIVYGGDCREEFSQTYNSGRDIWEDVEWNTIPEPMTVIEPDVEPSEPDVQPDVESIASVLPDGFITPFMAEHIPDEWMPELDQYLFGMIDLEGNVIYEPQFAFVNYIDSCGAYIVGGDVDGSMCYGIMNDDGLDFTGLIYDGAFYDIGKTEDESGHFYMTTYNNGILHVTSYDDLDLTDDDIDITVDEESLPYEATNLAVCHMDMNGALIRDCSEFYPHNVLIDVNTGELLHDFAESYGDELIYGDLIIDADNISNTVQIYSYDGELVFDDDDATGIYLDTYRYALAFDGSLTIIDREGNDHASVMIDPNATVDQGCGVIGVTDGDGTTFYDEDLNVIAQDSNVDLDDGYLSGRFSEGSGDNIIFVSFGDDTITNVMNGAVMDANDDLFYSHERDYIFANDTGNGNLSEHHWYLYDNEFNLLLEGDDYGNVLYDSFTSDMYVSEYSDGVTTLYSLRTYEPLLEADGRCSVRIINGSFLLTGEDEVRLFDSNGDLVYSSSISH